MKILQYKKMYLPALSIVAAVSLLLVLIGISTYRNLNRDKMKAMESVYSHGISMLRSVEIVSKAGKSFSTHRKDIVDNIIQDTAKEKDVAYIYLADAKKILTQYPIYSKEVDSTFWKPTFDNDNPIKSRTRKLSDGSEIYELAKPFPYFTQNQIDYDTAIVIGIKMGVYEKARHSDLHHAIIMVAILVSLGTGAFFFLFVIQNYYLVDKTLKQTQDYTRQVVANMANGLLSIDSNGRVVSYNQLALDFLDIDESKIHGLNLSKMIDFDQSGIQETLINSSSVMDREIYYKKQSGEVLPLALSVSPIPDNHGKFTGAVIVLRDLREIKRLENKIKRAEKMAAIGKIAAGIAHEIRNPLSSIRGFAKFLQHSLNERPKEREYAEVIVIEMDRINKVITDLLTFASPLTPDLAPCNINQLLEHVALLVKPDVQSREIEIRMNILSQIANIWLDESHMTNAVLNLLLNAIDAVERGGTIEVGANIDTAEKILNIWVEDDGKGISTELKEKIFDPYFTKREKGTGLGLPIVNKIVENHQGKVSVDSPPPGKSRGSRFIISIPIAES
jgi:two-component system sensor histidine kinase HydH